MQHLPAGYIGASGPRITDRKLPERYYGGPEVMQRQGGQKYNFLQKISKLSLDSKEQQHSTPTISTAVVVTSTNTTSKAKTS